MESGLIQRSTDAGFTFSMLDDGQSLEPAQPALIQMAFDAYLIRGGGALGVHQSGQAAGGVVGVRGLHTVGQRGGDQAAGGVITVGGRAGGLASPERLSEPLALCAIHKPAALYDSHCLKVFLFLALKAEKAVVL